MKKKRSLNKVASTATTVPPFLASKNTTDTKRRKAASEAKAAAWSFLEDERQQEEPLPRLPTHLVQNNDYFVGKDKRILLLVAPSNYSLSQSVCSYGYFCLAPNRWVPSSSSDDDEGYLVRPLRYGSSSSSRHHEHSVQVAIGQWGERIVVAVDDEVPTMDDAWLQQLVDQVARMLRLDMDLSEFHSLHPEAEERGFGRLYRSPTLFEDVVKTVTNCNMTWSGTVDMNAKLCRRLGGSDGAFPTPHEIRRSTPAFLKENCRLGYRSEWIWKIADAVAEGDLDLKGLEESDSSADLVRELRTITGVGEFASNNLLHLMGFFDSHPYDTETVRLFREDFGVTSTRKNSIFEKAKLKYERYKPYQFIAYWFDLWKNYERRAGAKSSRWSIEQNESERPDGVSEDHNRIFANSRPKKKSKNK